MTIKIVKDYKPSRYSEIGQTNEVKFSLARLDDPTTVTRLHKGFICRDFFNEIVYGNKYKRDFNIYGFYFEYEKMKFDKYLYLLVQYKNIKWIKQRIGWINKFMSEALPYAMPTRMHLTSSSDTILLQIDSVIFSRALFANMYTSLIKLAAYTVESNDFKELVAACKEDKLADGMPKGVEIRYIQRIEERFTNVECKPDIFQYMIDLYTVMSKLPDTFEFRVDRDLHTYYLHNYSGIIGSTQGLCYAIGISQDKWKYTDKQIYNETGPYRFEGLKEEFKQLGYF